MGDHIIVGQVVRQRTLKGEKSHVTDKLILLARFQLLQMLFIFQTSYFTLAFPESLQVIQMDMIT